MSAGFVVCLRGGGILNGCVNKVESVVWFFGVCVCFFGGWLLGVCCGVLFAGDAGGWRFWVSCLRGCGVWVGCFFCFIFVWGLNI
jgi:hypothetical protein